MTEHGLYFLKSEFYDIIRQLGGQWNDSKARPIVCLIKSLENELHAELLDRGRGQKYTRLTAAGKQFGLVTPSTSLLVLDNLEQFDRKILM